MADKLTPGELRRLAAIASRVLLVEPAAKRRAVALALAALLTGWADGQTITAPPDSSGTTPPRDELPS